jgi:hypothetical protein
MKQEPIGPPRHPTTNEPVFPAHGCWDPSVSSEWQGVLTTHVQTERYADLITRVAAARIGIACLEADAV